MSLVCNKYMKVSLPSRITINVNFAVLFYFILFVPFIIVVMWRDEILRCNDLN